MFGLFKRKKKQDPATQEQAPDQDGSQESLPEAGEDAPSTGTEAVERTAEEARRDAPAESSPVAPADTETSVVEPSPVAPADTAPPAAEALPDDVVEPRPESDDRPVASAAAPAGPMPEPDTTPSEAESALGDAPSGDALGAEAAPKPGMPPSQEPSQEPSPEPRQEPAASAADRERGHVEQDKDKGKKKGWFSRIKEGLGKTRANLSEGIADLFLGKKQIDDELMEDLETQLLMADVGIEATTEIIDRLTARVSRKELKEPQALYDALQDELAALLEPVAKDLVLPEKGEGPFVILMVGVNGVGKTTTIGKLAKRFQGQGRSVMLAAGDTFRAAAVEQLKVWGERNSVPVVAQHTGADSASVIYDALSAAKARGIDVLIADTAGRLHNKSHLMEELKKVQRVMGKLDAAAPHEVMLVLDAGTGQNALSQAATFNEAVPVTGITLTKLDGTAKGGIIFALAKQLGTPIRYIGVGETVDDLRPFAGRDFVDALFDQTRGE